MIRERTHPHCPFCDAPWTEAMLADLDRFTAPSSCACCGEAPHDTSPLPEPEDDLCCASCGRAIYLKPRHSH
jgi:hypothetical protein